MEIYKNHFLVEMYTQHEGHLHGFKKILASEQTSFQKVEIVDTHEYGRCLLLDGLMQSSQLDEYVYHELLVHPALTTHPQPSDVLIIGGGEGATLREVLKHPGVEAVDMVEIDGEVVAFAKRHLQEWHQGAFADQRTNLIIADGRRFLEQQTKQYDVVIVDISDPGTEGPAYLLYTEQFYRLLKDRLKANGILALQAGTSSVVQGDIMASIYKTLAQVFTFVHAYEGCIPSFDLPWGFCLAADKLDASTCTADEIDRRLRERQLNQLKAYDGQTHTGLMQPPKALRTMLASRGRVIKDKAPVFVPLTS